ncbi:hypothetical protein J7L06_03075 [Candidatus Bathyarchaeota archaeon]|nr:hypothetical protein [Candidatus Bathyarchaeota archaeon]
MVTISRVDLSKIYALLLLSLFLASSTLTVYTFSASTTKDGTAEKNMSDLVCRRLTREITISHFWQISIEDFYKISNVKVDNATSISQISLCLPPDARNVRAYDAVGQLKLEEGKTVNSSLKVWRILLRQTLRENETTSFTVNYELDSSKHIRQVGLEDYLFTLNMSVGNVTYESIYLKVKLPEGAYLTENLSEDANYKVEREFLLQVVCYTINDLNPNTSVKIALKYHDSIFSSSIRPVTISFVLVFIGAILAGRFRVRREVAPEVKAPPKELVRFINAYRDRLNILEELRSLEDRFKRGTISKKSYRKEKRRVTRLMLNATRELAEARKRLEITDPKLREMLRRIEVAETELEVVAKDVERAEHRYRRGEISKRSYESLLASYLKREEEARGTIEEILASLRELTA